MLRHMRKHTRVIMIVVITFFVLSCFAGYGLYARSGNVGSGDYAVAKINGRKIMRSSVESTMVRIAERSGISEITESDWISLRQTALDSMAVQVELEKEIKSRKLDVTKDEIESAYVNLMDSYPTREAFKQFLDNSGLKERAVKDDIKAQIQRDKVIQAMTSEIAVSDQDAREFYDVTKTVLYQRDDGYIADIASFRVKDTAQKAQAAIDGGANWDAVLEEHKSDLLASTSSDKSSEISELTMKDNLEFLKTYPLNKVSPVIDIAENEFAFVIKRSKVSARILPFDEVSEDVINSVRTQRADGVFEDLRDRAKVEILDASIFPSREVVQEEQTAVSEDAK